MWIVGILSTFLPFFPPPPDFLFWPRLFLKPFTSSSNTIEGGLTFFPHLSGWEVDWGSRSKFEGVSEVVGGAKTTAVAEIVDVDDNVPPGIEPGILGTAGFDFC